MYIYIRVNIYIYIYKYSNTYINKIEEAALWLSYTFLYVRMGRNPVAYGMSYNETFEDPQLDKKRTELVKAAGIYMFICIYMCIEVFV
jgi:hypothetical protein